LAERDAKMSGKNNRRKSIQAEIDEDEQNPSFDIFEKYDHYPSSVKRVIVGSDGMDVEEYGEDGLVTVLSNYHYKHFDYQLERNEKKWREILSEHGAAQWPHIVGKDAPESVKDVSQLLRIAARLRKCLKQGDMRASVYVAYHLGIVFQRWEVRWAERLVRHGKKMQASVPKAREAKKSKSLAKVKWVLGKADMMFGRKKREKLAKSISDMAPSEFKLAPGTIERILAEHRPIRKSKTFRRSVQSVGKHE
jgi:hypothetical protein